MSVSQAKIDFWIKNNLNVMFVGRHGVGKTAMVTDAFDRHKLKWRYFSASTMDPWCDFIGVPKEKNDNELCDQMQLVRQIATVNFETAVSYVQQNWKIADSNSAKELVSHALKDSSPTYLELVKPHDFANDQVEALFFDEFNRSPKKIRNAVMELIQFKSINGKKFSNLKLIWCAINPDNDETLKYDVETLDYAQMDRFQVSVNIPYKPNKDWFRTKYGNKIADSAILWWENLNEEVKNIVSPRRLQYALDCFVAKGDPRDILPSSSNVNKLISNLKNGPITDQVDEIFKAKDQEAAKEFIQNENNFFEAIHYILKSITLTNFFGPVIPKEKITSLMHEDDKFSKSVIENLDKIPVFHQICKGILTANLDPVLIKKIRKALTENENLQKAFAKESIEEPKFHTPVHFNKSNKSMNWNNEIDNINLLWNAKKSSTNTLTDRVLLLERILTDIPESITVNEAEKTLKLLDSLVAKYNHNINQFEKLFGVINHCLLKIKNKKGVSIAEILKESESIGWSELLNKIKTQNVFYKIVDDFKS